MDTGSEIPQEQPLTSGSFGSGEKLSTEFLGSKLETNYLLKFLPSAVICMSGVGVLLNTLVLDVNPRLLQRTSLNKWMKFLAIWDLILTTGLFALSLLFQFFDESVLTINDFTCKFLRFITSSVFLTSSSHLVAMAVDRALNITFPNWHHRMEFEKINWKISVAITVFVFVLNIPVLFFAGVEDDQCVVQTFNNESVNLLVLTYQIMSKLITYVFGNIGTLLAATGIFIYKLRKLRTTPMSEHEIEMEDESQTGSNIVIAMGAEDQNPANLPNSKRRKQYRRNQQVRQRKSKKENDMTMDGAIQILSEKQEGPVAAVSVNAMIRMVNEDRPRGEKRLTLDDIRSMDHQSDLESCSTITMEKIIHIISDSEPDPDQLLTTEEMVQILSDYQTTSHIRKQDHQKSRELAATTTACQRPSSISSNPGHSRTGNQACNDDASPEAISTTAGLSQDDIIAIRTVKWICLWYIFCVCSLLLVYSVYEAIAKTTYERENAQILQCLAMMAMTMNSSFNFLFYLSAKSFRNAFKRRYLPGWLYIVPTSSQDTQNQQSTQFSSPEEQ